MLKLLGDIETNAEDCYGTDTQLQPVVDEHSLCFKWVIIKGHSLSPALLATKENGKRKVWLVCLAPHQ